MNVDQRQALESGLRLLGFSMDADVPVGVRADIGRVIDELMSLRSAIKNAPHDSECGYINLDNGEWVAANRCTCWKTDVL